MNLFAALAIATLAFLQPVSAEQTDGAKPEPLSCHRGPVERYFGDVQWYVFACDDEATIVFYTGPKSPSDLEFYFLVYPKDGAYKVYGEGVGDQALTRPAYDAISAMETADYRALHAEASAVLE